MKDSSSNPLPSHFRFKTGIRFGIITSLINSLIGIALYSFGLVDFSGNSGGWISFLLIGLGIYLASEHYKKFSGGYMRQSDVVVTALWLGLISGIITVIFLLLQLQLDPSILEKMQNLMEFQLEQQNLEGAEYDKAMEIGSMFMKPWVLAVMTLISSLFMTLIVGFLLSFFLRKEQESPFS